MYLPKSRYRIINSPGGEFLNSDRSTYSGPVLETFRGEFYKGSSPQNAVERLIPISNRREKEILSNYYPNPSNSDFSLGYLYRYFIKNKTNGRELEVTKANYDTVPKDIYVRATVKWYLTGDTLIDVPSLSPKQAAIIKNTQTLSSLRSTFQNIDSFVSPEQFVR